jgi:drug/metabolite transporter (DMT)-like permease
MDKTTANPVRGIAMKCLSIMLFVGMQTLIKVAGQGIPTGEITFFRSLFAMPAILCWLAWRGELKMAFATKNPVGHFYRGFIGIISMWLGFYGLLHLPLPEAIAISYAMPLFAVIAGAVFLGEVVRRYRWSAVASGFVGVMIILWPRLTVLSSGTVGVSETIGAIAVLAAAAMGAAAMVQVRQLVRTEKTPTIVLYFSLTATVLSLTTLPLGWSSIPPAHALFLISAGLLGGIAQILLTESYRHADVSAVAPFEYSSIVWGTIAGYFVFGELPGGTLAVGTLIVVLSGVFIVYREARLHIETGRQNRSLTS